MTNPRLTEDPTNRDTTDRHLTDDREPVDRGATDRGITGEHEATDRDVTDDRDAINRDVTGDHDVTGDRHVTDHDATRDVTYHDVTGGGEPAVVEDEPVELSAVPTTADDAPLFNTDDMADYQAEWRTLQADFVDDPREAVQRADELVAQVMQSLTATFAEHKHALESQWQQGDDVQTEELRQALKRYRAFFDRLLSA